ncbi:MAG: DUF948 domain-containing protein [Candidatus Rokuibacteriota bacterium]
MQLWAEIALVVCAVAITVALVPALIAVRRASERAERVLAVAEQELRPLIGEVQNLLQDVRMTSQEVRDDVARIGAMAERAQDLSEGLGRVVSAVAGLTRAGQLVGVAAGIKTGLDVFFHRLRRQQGDDNE